MRLVPKSSDHGGAKSTQRGNNPHPSITSLYIQQSVLQSWKPYWNSRQEVATLMGHFGVFRSLFSEGLFTYIMFYLCKTAVGDVELINVYTDNVFRVAYHTSSGQWEPMRILYVPQSTVWIVFGAGSVFGARAQLIVGRSSFGTSCCAGK